MEHKFYKKFPYLLIVLFLIVLMISSSLLPFFASSAKAQFVVSDPAHTAVSAAKLKKSILERVIDGGARIAAQIAIERIVASTVRWANTGFEGNPAYVTDPKQYFGDIADGVAGDFIQNSAELGFLCSPFQAQIRLSLAQQYYEPRPFQCTLTEVVGNIEAFYNDFSQGGWDAWFSMTQNSTNNPYGAYLNAKIELDSRIANAVGLKEREYTINQGYLSWGECIRWENLGGESPDDGSGEGTGTRGRCLERGPVKTPGAHIKSQLDKVLPAGLDKLITVKHIEDLAEAFAVGLLQKYVFGSEGLFSNDGAQGVVPTGGRAVDIDNDGVLDGQDTNSDGRPDICYFGGVTSPYTAPCRGSEDTSDPPYVPPPPSGGGGQCNAVGRYESDLRSAMNDVLSENQTLASSMNTVENGRTFMRLTAEELSTRGFNATADVLNGNSNPNTGDLIALWIQGDSLMERYDAIIDGGSGQRTISSSATAQFVGAIPLNCTATGGGRNCADSCNTGGTSPTPTPSPQPNPTLGNAFIQSISPTSAQAGVTTITIFGSELTNQVSFYDGTGARNTVVGSVNSSRTQTTVLVPSSLPVGNATVRIYQGNQQWSNGILIQVTAGGTSSIPTVSPTTTWTPPQTVNGWWPTLSPNGRYVAYGNWGESWVTDLTTGQTRDFSRPSDLPEGGGRCLAGHWLTATTLTFTCEFGTVQNPTGMSRYEVAVGEWVARRTADASSVVESNIFRARDGHWASYAAGQFRLVRDGQVIATNIGGAMSISGNQIVHACTNSNAEICVRENGILTRTYTPQVPLFETATNNGYILYGGYGPVRGITPFGSDVNLRLSTSFNEGAQDIVMVNGSPWVVTNAWSGQEDNGYIFLRPWGSSSAIAIAANASHVRVAVVGTNFVVAYNSDVGRLSVVTVPINAPRNTVN